MTRSYGYDAATGVLSVMRAGWVLDDVDRFASRVDNVAGLSRSYSYGDAGHPFAVTSVSGVGVYGYDQVGAMVSRAGGTLVYDAMHRLVSYAGESYVQSTSNQRLVVTGPAGRVLYLGEVEVTANGPTRTITRHVTIDGTVVAVTTTTGSGTAVVWSCAHPQNSVTCHAPTSGATPGVRRYHPYGTARNSVTTPATTRGYLGQPADTTGLAYLDNRYYDPDLGVFLSVDPLIATTGTPYLYANANPTTLSDPTGLEPGCGATAWSAGSCADAHNAVNIRPMGRPIPDGWSDGAGGGHWDAGIADALTGNDIGDYTDFIVAIGRRFGVDPALIIALGLIEQGYTGLCRGCTAALEESIGSHSDLFDTHGLTNIGQEVFLRVWAKDSAALTVFVPSGYRHASPRELWTSLGEQNLDRLALVVTTLHIRDRVEYFSSLTTDARLGVSNNEFAALSWNFNLMTISAIAQGLRVFGANTRDYVQTLRNYYYNDAMRWVCPDSCDFRQGSDGPPA